MLIIMLVFIIRNKKIKKNIKKKKLCICSDWAFALVCICSINPGMDAITNSKKMYNITLSMPILFKANAAFLLGNLMLCIKISPKVFIWIFLLSSVVHSSILYHILNHHS